MVALNADSDRWIIARTIAFDVLVTLICTASVVMCLRSLYRAILLGRVWLFIFCPFVTYCFFTTVADICINVSNLVSVRICSCQKFMIMMSDNNIRLRKWYDLPSEYLDG